MEEKTYRADILVVDDTPANVELLETILVGEGYHVRPATSGSLALRTVQAKLPDLILLDIRLPGMDGLEVCRRLKADEKTRPVPVIFITVVDDEKSKVQAFEAGAADFITKPFYPEEVTARVKAHLANKDLAASEELFRQFFENSPVGKSMTSVDGSLRINQAFCDMLGYLREEMIQMKWQDITHPDDLKESEGVLRTLLEEKGRKLRFEKRYMHKTGKIIWAEVNTSMQWNRDGTPRHMLTSVLDITDRKQAQEALQASEGRYRTVLDNAADSIIIHDENGKILEVNRKTCENLGYTREELLSLSIGDIDPEAIGAGKGLLWNEVIGGKAFTFESRQKRKDNTFIPVEITLGSIKLSGGPVILGIVRDISERKESEEQFRKLSLRNKAILESVPDIIMEVDRNKVYTWANHAGFKFFGQDVIGREAGYYFEGEQETYGLVKPLFEGQEEIIYVESWQRRADGEKRLLAWWCRVLKDQQGNVTGALSTARDITEEKLYQMELKELNATRDKFFSIIAHDLKSPYNALLGLSRILANEDENLSPGDVRKFSNRIHMMLSNNFELLQNLLEWARLQLGKVECKPEMIDLSDLVNNISGLLSGSFLKKNIDLRNEVPETIRVFGDHNMLHSVLQNIISNAIKFTGVNGNVRVTASKTDHQIELVIADTGMGISRERLDTIFQLGSVYSTKGTDGEKGTGLGIILCKELLEKQGGSIEIFSEENVGTTVKIILPGSPEKEEE